MRGAASRFGRSAALALAGLLVALPASAQWTSNNGFQLLQRVDDVLFGVDTVTLSIVDRDHVAGTLVRVNAKQPDPVRGRTEFVARCSRPLQVAQLAPAQRARPPLAQLEFGDAQILDGTWFAAEFACESTRQPARAARLARELYQQGGPPDMQTLYCDLLPDGGTEPRPGVEIRFSEAFDALAVNDQWLSTGKVSAEELRFGSVGTWVVDRLRLGVRKNAVNGEMVYSGVCDKRPPAGARR